MEKKTPLILKKLQALYPKKQFQVWFQDEARYGQRGIVTKIWSAQGQRPTLPRKNGFKSAYLIGAVSPASGNKYAMVMDGLDTHVMSFYLEHFSRHLPKSIHALMVVDGAGWHSSDELMIPKNITLVPLPPYSPELNPIEQIWGYLKSNFLSHRIFRDMKDVFDQGVRAWQALEKEVIRSICAGAIIK